MTDCLLEARHHLDWMTGVRRQLHQAPELSLQEKTTAAFCRNILQQLGYQIQDSFGYGFTADLCKPDAQRCIALRADMDALPIQELNSDLDYCSQHPGVGHMCGHDVHMTIALGAARIIAEHQDQLNINVRFLFQPSEELPPGGAKGMIDAGCLDGVDEVYGLHNDPGMPVGQIRTREGALTAIADLFSLTLTGRGCHAARPHDGLDPIIVGAQLITQWQSIITRYIDPNHSAVLTVGQFQAGEAPNAVADTAYIGGTIRTFERDDRDLILNHIQQSLLPYQQQGYQCQLDYNKGYDSIVNHASGVSQVVAAASKILEPSAINPRCQPEGWGEDFAYFLQHRPGAFYFLGSGNTKLGITESLHSPRFQVDEDCLLWGSAIMAELILGPA